MRKSLAVTMCALSITAVVGVGMGNVSFVYAAPTAIVADIMQTKGVRSANWDPSVKAGLNDFLRNYGNTGSNYTKGNRPYAVFDFDNTTSIMDVEEQLMIWQLDHLAFAIKPEKMDEVLRTGIPVEKIKATYGAEDGSGRLVTIDAAINDATKA